MWYYMAKSAKEISISTKTQVYVYAFDFANQHSIRFASLEEQSQHNRETKQQWKVK